MSVSGGVLLGVAPGAAIVVLVGGNPVIANPQVVVQANVIGVVSFSDVVVIGNNWAGVPNTGRSDQRVALHLRRL